MLVRVIEDVTVSHMMAHKWSERFRGSAELTENEQCTGHLLTSTMDKNVSKINEII
jgi:hypothetical protein